LAGDFSDAALKRVFGYNAVLWFSLVCERTQDLHLVRTLSGWNRAIKDLNHLPNVA